MMKESYVEVAGKKIWVGSIGEDQPGTPLLVVHGGPGFCSIVEFAEDYAQGRPVYLYDQLGSLRSDKADSIETYTVDYFIHELDTVIHALGLEKLVLMGVSWGGGLAAKYLLDKKPKGIAALVLNSPFLSAGVFEEDIRRNVEKLPIEVQQTLERLEQEGNFGEEYECAVLEYYKAYGCRARPLPPLVNQMMMTANYEVYGKLWGPSEMKLTGDLKDFDLMADLPRIDVPVLLIAGDQDEITVEGMRTYHLAIPGSELAIIPGTGHLNAIEKPELFKGILNQFTARF